ncbi:MAG: hypothetical protein CV088_05370 [Nitrospira sp. LK70]|nr:hypothetical protein [Nitrospira sp. LK70]
MTHIIRQQYVHVEVDGTEADGLALQRRLPGLCRRSLNPAVELVLNRHTSSDRYLSIERLEIDVGTVSLERLEHDLAEAVALALERSLREQLPISGGSTATAFGKIRHKTDRQRIHEAFMYFLQTGRLPWSFHLPQGKTLEQVILDSWRQAVESDLISLMARDAVHRLLESSAVRKRLVRQFSPLFLKTFVTLLSPRSEQVMAALLERLRRSIAAPEQARDLERVLWETLLANMAGGKLVTVASLVGDALRAFSTETVARDELARLSAEHWPEATNKAPADHIVESEPTPPGLLPSENSPIEREVHPEAREGIYVENAGLVLLHPFLPQLFSALGIADDDHLLQPARALSLLHFLATGRTVAPEYELVLPKILCHVTLGTPVESPVDLTVVEQEEAVALLEAVIRHWQVLRNTSPDGLRGAFLLRPGKVSFRDDGDWLLQIESCTHDILLDQLPWGLSMIKLPWMGHKLRVGWR